MKLSMHWLADFVDVSHLSTADFASGMTLSGSKVETMASQADKLNCIVAAKVLEVNRHPDADRLFVCPIDAGQPLTIVTAATNLTPGVTVPVALAGAVLPDGLVIKPTKMRGVVSQGMFCSFAELGLQHSDVPYADENGILILQQPAAPGTPIAVAMGLDDTTVEFEITNNRPDCLSVRGLAREAAATFGRALTLPQPPVSPLGGAVADELTVEVEDAALCPRYCARMVKSITIAPSPDWMQNRLRASGIRAINNIVDITNYVMLEYGQPMHAFDLSCVGGNTIKVRTARAGETLETLDGKQHALDAAMLVIADAQKPIGLAGVMGGGNSEITDATTDIVFESATFDGPSVRRTALALNMRTDSSARFEKGLDPANTIGAVERACQLVEQLGCGTVVDGHLDVCAADLTPRTMTLEPDKINALLGTAIGRDDMVALLVSLGFGIDGDVVTIPSWRGDVSIMPDLAEEIARLRDYNSIENTLNASTVVGALTAEQQAQRKINQLCRALGYSEFLTYSFHGTGDLDAIGLPSDAPERRAVTLLNPLGEDTALMKTTLLPSLLQALQRNDSLSAERCALFTLGHIFIKTASVLPDEQRTLALGGYGEGYDFFALKGAVDALAAAFTLPPLTYEADADNATFHPGRCARISCNGTPLGVLGQLHPTLADEQGLTRDCLLCQLNFDAWLACALPERKFAPLPRYPAMRRDIAVVCAGDITNAQLLGTIADAGGALLVDVALFDVYTGSQVTEGHKSMAYALTLRANDRTLTDAEADAVVARILKRLAKEYNAVQR